jgi:hypothetical protein
MESGRNVKSSVSETSCCVFAHAETIRAERMRAVRIEEYDRNARPNVAIEPTVEAGDLARAVQNEPRRRAGKGACRSGSVRMVG